MKSKVYRTVIADPPWHFNDKLLGPKRGAAKHYVTMSVEDIKALPLPPLADDCRLFLWRVAAMQQEALDVMRAWGFELKTELVWLKKTVNGKRAFGMGRTLRAEHEICLIGARGKPELLSRSMRSTFEAPIGEHSRKPEEFYNLVEQLSPGPFTELFARRHRPGWTCMGFEVETSNNARAAV